MKHKWYSVLWALCVMCVPQQGLPPVQLQLQAAKQSWGYLRYFSALTDKPTVQW